MARQVLPIVGAVAGAYLGSPQLGYVIGSLVGNAVDPMVVKGPKIGEAGVQTSAEGVFRPVVYGTAAVMGNVIERGNRQIKKKRTSQGKGGPVTEEERVYWTFAIRICEGPVTSILRIWEDEKLVYDKRPESTIPEETADFASRIRIYLGTDDQLPDPDLEVIHGVGNAAAYPGTVYFVYPNCDLTDRRESIPSYRFEVSTTTSGLFWDYQWDGPFSYPANAFSVGSSFYSETWERFVVTNGQGRRLSSDGRSYTAFGSNNYFNGAENPHTGMMVFIDSSNNLRVSYDGGETVSLVTSGAGSSTTGSLRWVENQYAFMGFTTSRPYLISDNGQLYTSGSVIPGLGTNPSWVNIPGQGFFVGGQDGKIYFSDSPLSGYYNISTVPIAAGVMTNILYDEQNDRLLALCTQGAIWESTDAGATWQKVMQASTGVDFLSGIVIPELGVVYIAGSGASSNVAISVYGSPFELVTDSAMNNWFTFAYSTETLRVSAAAQLRVYSSDLTSNENDCILSSVVASIAGRAAMDSSKFDVTELDDVVFGIALAGDYTCAEAIQTLAQTYFFDSPEYEDGTGYKIRYRKRGGEVVRVLTEDDLIDVTDETKRQDALERPKVLHLSYQSPTIGYAAAKASPMRNSPDVRVVGEVAVQVPVAFNDVNEAWRRADIMLRQAYAEVGGEEQVRVSDRHLDLIPSDPIAISLRGQVRRERITQTPIEPGIVTVNMLPDRQSAYTSNLTGIPLPEPTPPPPSIVGATILSILDIPALNDNNDRLLFYAGMSGQTSAWYGAVLQMSTDDGTSWQEVGSTRAGTVMGVLLSEVASASSYYTDTTNVVSVALYNPDDELETLTDAQFLSEGGSFAIEYEDSSGKHWEILQGRDAVQDSSGNWDVSHLLRGRLNTEAVHHSPGARVVFLDSVISVDAQSGWIGRELKFRAVSLGTSPESAAVISIIYTGQSQIEWPVAHLFLERDTNTINAQTVPRNRFGTEDRPIRSTNWQGYSWTATDGANTLSITTIEATASFDVTGWASPVTVSVAQVNRITGNGPSVSEQIA